MIRAASILLLVFSMSVPGSAQEPLVLTPLGRAQAGNLEPGNTFRECSRCPLMVVIPPGTFLMGSPPDEPGHDANEEPRHEVHIPRAFAVSKYHVTAAEWRACAAQRGCRDDADDGWGDDHPVTGPSWNDAQSYVTWLSKLTGGQYRLLTEAEYEYAARAGTRSAYPWGSDLGKANANCHDCGSQWDDRSPSPVGSFRGNDFGLFDMLGNVQSFVEDCFHDDYRGAPSDGTAWSRGDCFHRVARGGSWARPGEQARSSSRGMTGTMDRYPDLGLRIARGL